MARKHEKMKVNGVDVPAVPAIQDIKCVIERELVPYAAAIDRLWSWHQALSDHFVERSGTNPNVARSLCL
jgi:hypothetical protein